MVLYRQGNELVDIILGLTSRSLDNHIVRRGLEVFFAAAIRMLSPFPLHCRYPLFSRKLTRRASVFADGNHFAFLTSPTESTPGLAGQPPLIERLSRYLISPHPNTSSEEVSGLLYSGYSQLLIFCPLTCTIQILKMNLMIVKGMCMMAVSNTDAVVLMGSRTILVPALVLVLQAESSKIWGIHAYSTPVEE